jgi:hypothetical protein
VGTGQDAGGGADVHGNYLVNGSVAFPVVAGRGDVSRSVMIDAAGLVGTVSSGLSALVIEDVADTGETIEVRARTRGEAVACPAAAREPAGCTGITSGRSLTCRPTAVACW